MSVDTQFQLVDFIASYPSQNNPNIQQIITSKREFFELQSEPNEKPPKRGEFYKPQLLIQRLMKIYNRMFLMWGTGTGKTCAAVASTEYFKNISIGLYKTYLDAIHTNMEIDGVIVLVRGPSLIEEFKNQLVCNCTKGEYESKTSRETKSQTIIRKQRTIEVSKWYDVTTYRTFAEKIKDYTDQELIDQFSGKIFFVDEVHNLKESAKSKQGQPTIYQIYQRLFNTVDRCKVIIASATPMINTTKEIIGIMNLILPINQKIPKSIDLDNSTLETLSKYFNGRVSYVRELETGAVPKLQGDVLETEYDIGGKIYQGQTKVVLSTMSDFQQEAYLRYYLQNEHLINEVEEEEEADTDFNKEAEKSGFRREEREACNFVFPDGSVGGDFNRSSERFGNSGISKYVKESKGQVEGEQKVGRGRPKGKVSKKSQYIISDELKRYLRNPEQFQILSPKYYLIYKTVSESEGLHFCYSEFLNGSGAIMLGLCFQANNFEEYDGKKSPFTQTQIRKEGETSCENYSTEERNRLVTMEKRNRYALLTSTHSKAEFNNIIQLFNSKENMNGEYIKVIIGSPVSRDGINLANVQGVHLVSPGWNQSGMYQALSRALRSTSHIMILEQKKKLIREEREKKLDEGFTEEQVDEMGLDPEKVTVDVKIYKHASVMNSDANMMVENLIEELQSENVDVYMEEDIDLVGNSVEYQMYQLAEEKDIKIKRIERFIKQSAIDCQIQRKRNIRPTDINGSAACDYQDCDYQCLNNEPEFIDDSTYNIYYVSELVKTTLPFIRQFFAEKNLATYDDLATYLDVTTKEVSLIIESLTKDRISVTDSFGYVCYLYTYDNLISLQREYPLYPLNPDAPSLAWYTQNILTCEIRSLDEAVNFYKQETIVEEEEIEDIDEYIEGLTTLEKSQALEKALIQQLKGELSEMGRKVLDKFKCNYYIMKEPVTALEKIKEDRAGRKVKNKLSKELKEELKIKEEGEEVYIHNLQGLKEELTKYAATSKIKKGGVKLRIYKPSVDVDWRDLVIPESFIYEDLIEKRREKQIKELPFDPMVQIHGTEYEGDFRIIDPTIVKKTAKKDLRYEVTGQICKTRKLDDLFKIMLKLSIPLPNITIDIPNDRSDLIRFLIRKKYFKSADDAAEVSRDELVYAYTWYNSSMTKVDICELIHNFMVEHDLIKPICL